MDFEFDERQLQTSKSLNQRPREFHLGDLPQNQIFARLDFDYRRALIVPLIERFGVVRVSKWIDVHPKTLRGWAVEDAKRLGQPRTGYIRLDVLFRLGKMAKDEKFSPQKIEMHVVALKGYGCSLPAYGMCLPLLENAPIIHLLMHFMGDGSIYPIVGSTKVSAYSNQNAQLREGFIASLREVFGDVSSCIREDLSQRNRLHVRVPKWIPYILAHLYPDALFGQLQSKLPEIIFSLPRHLKIEAIRALADDDGSVQELCIRFVSGSSALLQDTRRLILQVIRDDSGLVGPEKEALENAVSTVKRQRNWYRLDLGFRMFRWYRDRINFSHPEKAQELEFRIKAAQRTKRLDALACDSLIFSELMNGQRTAQEIALAHYIREEYVHRSLRYHSTSGRVVKCGKSLRRKKAASQWTLTEDGRRWLQTLRLVNTDRRKHFMREVFAKGDYMRYRWLKPMDSPVNLAESTG